MSNLTPNFGLIVPAKGEFEGTWNEPVNANFVSIDRILAQLLVNSSSGSAPATNPNGSFWWDSSGNRMFLKVKGAYVRAVTHLHDGIDLEKIDLSLHTKGILPASMIDGTGLNAYMLAGMSKDDFFYMAGDGLEKNGPVIAMKKVYQEVDNRTFNTVNVDLYGRVISGTLQTVAAHTHSEYANKEGDSSRQFLAASPSMTQHVITLLYGNTHYHPLGGDANKTFKVMSAGTSDEAISLGQANALYSPIHTHPYAAAIHNHNLDYSNISHTHSEFALISGASTSIDTIYAKINGDSSKRFKIATGIDNDDAITLLQAKNAYALTTHTHSGFAPTSHTHATYAALVHTHTDYADKGHEHTAYAMTVHTHTDYSLTSHNHNSNYSDINHDHNTSYAQLAHTHTGTYAPLVHAHATDYAPIAHSHASSEYVRFSTGGLFETVTLGTMKAPVANTDFTNKLYVDGVIATAGTTISSSLSSTYAAIGGNSNQSFKVKAPTMGDDAISKTYADSTYAKVDIFSSFNSSKANVEDVYSKDQLRTINLLDNSIVNVDDGNGNITSTETVTRNVYIKSESDSTYLSKTDAASIYLKMTDSTTYLLSKADAASTYLTIANASSTYQTKIAANTYMSYVAPDAAITNATASVAVPTKAEFDAVVSKLNAALAALRSHGIIS